MASQVATLRRKRSERDARFKQQAEKSKKRKRKNGPEDAPSDATEGLLLCSSEASDKAGPDAPPGAANSVQHPLRVKLDLSNLPKMLPDNYLDDDDDEMRPQDPLDKSVPSKQLKSLKLQNLSRKAIKDKRHGNTIFRVTSPPEYPLLATKTSLQARRVKENWLAGSRSGYRDRKPARRGFLAKDRQI